MDRVSIVDSLRWWEDQYGREDLETDYILDDVRWALELDHFRFRVPTYNMKVIFKEGCGFVNEKSGN